MPVQAQLEQALRDHARDWVGRAAKDFANKASTMPSTPLDTGSLAVGMKPGQVKSTGNTVESDIESTTKNAGFDYPEYIDKVARVMPTRRKFLRFMVGGTTVFSRGFTNRHRGWWKKSVTQARWTAALRDTQR